MQIEEQDDRIAFRKRKKIEEEKALDLDMVKEIDNKRKERQKTKKKFLEKKLKETTDLTNYKSKMEELD